jgi:hypothetical protein
VSGPARRSSRENLAIFSGPIEKPPNVSFFGGPTKKTAKSNHVFGGPKNR